MAKRGMALVLALGVAAGASAQIAPYAMFNAGRYSGPGVGSGTPSNASGAFTAYGGTFGVYDDFVKLGPARLGGDVRVIADNSGNSTAYGNKVLGGLFGLRLDGAGIPSSPVNPFLQAEIGDVATNNGTNYDRSGSFAYQVQGGGDFPVFPRLAVRLEYGVGQLTSAGGGNHTLQTFGAGLVLKL